VIGWKEREKLVFLVSTTSSAEAHCFWLLSLIQKPEYLAVKSLFSIDCSLYVLTRAYLVDQSELTSCISPFTLYHLLLVRAANVCCLHCWIGRLTAHNRNSNACRWQSALCSDTSAETEEQLTSFSKKKRTANRCSCALFFVSKEARGGGSFLCLS
jgi:hypothetical protein